MAFLFSPLKDFKSQEFESTYCRGLGYTVRDGNDKLAAAVQTWLKEGKVRLGGAADQPVEASMKRLGQVALNTKEGKRMTDEQLIERIQSEADAQLVFEGNGPLSQEFTDAAALWGYVKAIRAGRVRVSGRGRVGAAAK